MTDQKGRKICDEKLIGNIQKVSTRSPCISDLTFVSLCSLGGQLRGRLSNQNCFVQALSLQKKKWTAEFQKCPGRCIGTQTISEHTAIELTGADRPGLLSEISAVLAEMNCRVVAAEAWTHKRRVACVLYVTDEDTLGPIDNVRKLERILEKLKPIMQGYDGEQAARSVVAESFTHVERRLHQLMFADHDFELSESQSPSITGNHEKPEITVNMGSERNYSVINVKVLDRPKLLFDTVCTLTDMKYVVFHATIDSSGPYALQVILHFFSFCVTIFVASGVAILLKLWRKVLRASLCYCSYYSSKWSYSV